MAAIRQLHGTGATERREEIPHFQGQEQRPRGNTPRPWSGAAAALCWSSREELPHVQGKRNPSKTVGAEKGKRGQLNGHEFG